jgi:GNAT superfamily N-acetyltransferase
MAAIGEVDRTGEHYSVADLAEELTDPELDLAHDSVLVLDAGRPVGYQVLRLRAVSGRTVVDTDGGVHPAHRRRGIGAVPLAFARRRAADLDAVLQVRVPEQVTGAVALVERAGLVPVRWWTEMRRDLTMPVADVPLPEGLEMHPLGPGYDAARRRRERDGRLRRLHPRGLHAAVPRGHLRPHVLTADASSVTSCRHRHRRCRRTPAPPARWPGSRRTRPAAGPRVCAASCDHGVPGTAWSTSPATTISACPPTRA